jgi:hypothetical protein
VWAVPVPIYRLGLPVSVELLDVGEESSKLFVRETTPAHEKDTDASVFLSKNFMFCRLVT